MPSIMSIMSLIRVVFAVVRLRSTVTQILFGMYYGAYREKNTVLQPYMGE